MRRSFNDLHDAVSIRLMEDPQSDSADEKCDSITTAVTERVWVLEINGERQVNLKFLASRRLGAVRLDFSNAHGG